MGLFQANKIIPVVVIDDITIAVKLAYSLLDAGVTTLEITLRTNNALNIIHEIAHKVPEMVVGAGTILNPSDFDKAVAAGARYIISPGISTKLLNHASASKFNYIPGVCTPSQAMEALEHGFSMLKFFPAEVYNGKAAIKTLASVMPEIKFCPTGGINLENLIDYLSLKNVFAVGLSEIVEAKLIQAHEFDEITKRARKAVDLANFVKKI